MQRFQVKAKQKAWDEKGPDLLRTKPDAIVAAVGALKVKGPWYWRKLQPSGEWFAWREIGDRAEVTEWLHTSLEGLSDGQMSQLGLGSQKGLEPDVALRGRYIPIPDLDNATPRAELTHGLVRARFPDIKFAGCFVCKRYNDSNDPSVGFSDHAWGDAVDETENQPAGVDNDAVTDWCLRMAQAGLMPVEQVLGSARGKVYSWVAPDFHPVATNIPSHTWHVHLSCIRHTGTPPCAG